jgi:hypothetical protein
VKNLLQIVGKTYQSRLLVGLELAIIKILGIADRGN